MNKIKIIFLTIILTLLLISSCSQKKNFLGFEQEIENKIATDTLSNSVNFIKSYISGSSNYPDNSKLIVGKFKNVEVRSILKFRNLPDTSWIDTVNINSCEIVIIKKKLFDTDFNIKVYKVERDWQENSVTQDTLWDDFSDELSEFSTDLGDTITFSIDTIFVKSWIQSDSTNYGIIFKPDDVESDFVEFCSSEGENSPYLKIEYTEPSEADSIRFKICNVSEDTFIGFDENFVNGEILNFPIIQNLYPTRTVFSFCMDSLINLLEDTSDSSKITINKAAIIFDSTMIDSAFVSDSYLEVKPYYISDTTSINYENIAGSKVSKFYKDDQTLEINVSGIIQGYLRGELENNQFLIESTTENKDFSYIKFADDLKPYLKIIYTKPVLVE